MRQLCWILIFGVFTSHFSVKGHDACYANGWTYPEHTHSCFRLFRENKAWTEAKLHCREFPGQEHDVLGHLSKIDDYQTNNLVRSLLSNNSWQSWIGLHYQEDAGEYRWDAFPNQTISFADNNWVDRNLSLYVSMDASGWVTDTPGKPLPFVCQHRARNIEKIYCEYHVDPLRGLNFSCTAEKSYSDVICEWRYINEDGSSSSWSAWATTRAPVSVLLIPVESEGKDSYYKIMCSLIIGRPFNFQQGTMTLEMRMHASVPSFSPSTTQDNIFFTTNNTTVDIQYPEKPIFSTSNLTLEKPPLIIVEGYKVRLTCHINGSKPPLVRLQMYCDSWVITSNVVVTSSSYSMTLSGISLSKIPSCSCEGENVATGTGAGMDFVVIVPASHVTCNTELTPYVLQVTCETGRIYPQAVCQWFYQNEISENRSWMPTDWGKTVYSTSVLDYYISICSMTFTPHVTPFRPGMFSYRLLLHPFIPPYPVAPGQNYTSVVEESFEIELPGKPIFKFLNEAFQDNTLSFVAHGQALNLTCEIKSGKPTVQSVTLACDFPVNDVGETSQTYLGTSYTMTTTASSDLNGRTCSCWGDHITGSTDNSSLRIEIKHVKVKSFAANGNNKAITVDLNQRVTVSCDSDGTSERFVTIMKLSAEDENTTISQGMEETSTTFQARCSDNGIYQCDAQTMINDTIYQNTKNMVVHVICPPSVCENRDVNPTFDLDLRTGLTVSICAIAYPLPDKSRFILEKADDEDWSKVESNVYSLNLEASNGTLLEVQIIFNDLSATDYGYYRLFYPQETDRTYSFLHFQLNDPDGSSSSSSLSTGIVLVIIVGVIAGFLLLAVASALCVCTKLRKHTSKNQDRETRDFDEPPVSDNNGSYEMDHAHAGNQSGRLDAHPYLTPIEGFENHVETDSTYDSINEDAIEAGEHSHNHLYPNDTSDRDYSTIQDSSEGLEDDYLQPRNVLSSH